MLFRSGLSRDEALKNIQKSLQPVLKLDKTQKQEKEKNQIVVKDNSKGRVRTTKEGKIITVETFHSL